ncbi:MAG: hypothetical protein AAF901_10835 [Bacteroidota bacterium]
MTPKKGIHFEISERKILLRLLDIAMAFFGIYTLNLFFNFDYLEFSMESTIPLVVLAIYISIFGTVFELYDLKKA